MSGGSNHAAQQAQAAEQDRQAQIANTTSRINAIYDDPNRESQINDFGKATRDYYMGDLNRQNDDNNRKLRFSMARNHQTGGSVALDNQGLADQAYTRGVLDVERRAQGSMADMRGQDEQSRMSLIGMAQAGLDATTASQQANARMRSDLASANATARSQQLGDSFGNFADIYQRSRDAAAQRQGWSDYGLLYQPGFGYGGGKR